MKKEEHPTEFTPEQQSRVKRKQRDLQEKGVKVKDYFFSSNVLWVVLENGEHKQAHQL